MTKSTGKAAGRKRREELFAAEMILRRVRLHLNNAFQIATFYRDVIAQAGYVDAWTAVHARSLLVVREQKALR